MVSTESRARFLQRSAGEVKRYRVTMQFIKAVVGVLLVATTITFVASALYSRTGNFTVGINKFEFEEYGLTLSESADFSEQTSQLTAKAHDNMTNISINDLPGDLDSIDGSHNGKNHLAYTFYVKNAGTKALTYVFQSTIVNVTNEVDTCIRIRIYRNGEYVDYARTASDGSGPEPGTTAFLNESIVCRTEEANFMPGQISKYTVVIWVEGDDPECVDARIGGVLKVSANMSVLASHDNESSESAE